MTEDSNISTEDSAKDDPLIELMMTEYGILQEKIDKIGGFRFMIKGWALTLNTGALVAATATSLDPVPAVSLVFLLLLALWLLEYRQDRLSDIFQDRALRIENSIGKRLENHGLRRIDFVTLRRIPGIANELRNPYDHRRPERIAASSLSKRGKKRSKLMSSRPMLAFNRWPLKRKVMQSDLGFYVILFIISIGFVYFQRPKANPINHAGGVGHFLKTSGSPGNADIKFLRRFDAAKNK